ncbi:MAG TPA: [FeFe] hydrogenase H-cluster maturation GTPase HydF, partial [Thermoanaerobaculia bacterium]|nr:[FeFe] hydrogenase H-cluster maturation GTPase HydF [Thermoanaerobaculia bacterium]
MSSAPRGLRTHIGLFGRRNVGKSSVLNALTRQEVAIVSATPGTTTDPVEKPMELLPLGPVVFIDTAGVDDEGALGEQRIAKTRAALDRTDLALLVAEAPTWGPFEEELLGEIRARSIPVVVVLNKADTGPAPAGLAGRLAAAGVPAVATSILSGAGLDELRQALLAAAPADAVVLVTPIDAEAPKGRLILPQVQTLRDLLDNGAISVVVREHELHGALDALGRPPRLVVTDSQAFRQVAAEVPPGVPLTSFSILFARFQGDLAEMARGVRGVDRLKAGDRVLVAEACTHHPVGEDIGRVKIPAWLRARTGVPLEFETVQGRDFPDDLSRYALVVHCGSCMGNRRQMLSRLLRGRREGVPVTNYGLTIAYS